MKQPSKKQSPDSETEKPIDKFAEMISVMDYEHLLRFRNRLEKVGKKEMVKILTFEIKAKAAAEREAEAARFKEIEELRRKDLEAQQ